MRKCAVLTIVQDEAFFLEIWLKHYSKYFSQEDLYVIDNETRDGSVEAAKRKYQFKSTFIHNNGIVFDHKWLVDVVQKAQRKLLESYEYVLFTEVDEILIPDPDTNLNLRQFIEQETREFVTCTNRNVVQSKNELKIDTNKSILSQRSQWYYDDFFSKTLLSRIPLNWSTGFHVLIDKGQLPIDENLLMIHLHYLDYDAAKERNIKRSMRKKSIDFEKHATIGYQHFLLGDDFDKLFWKLRDAYTLEEIPEKYKSLL